MASIQAQELFVAVRPLCANVLQETNPAEQLALVRRLLGVLDAFASATGSDGTDTAVAQLAEYLLFPMVLLLKNPQATQLVKEASMDVLAWVLQRAAVTSAVVADDMCTTLAMVIHGHIRTGADETKDAAVRVCSILFRPWFDPSATAAANGPRLQVLLGLLVDEPADAVAADGKTTTSKAHLRLALLVSALLEAASTGRLASLRERSLKLLQQMADATATLTTKAAYRRSLAGMLPGIVSTLTKMLLHDTKERHAILVGALNTLGAWLGAIFTDEPSASYATSSSPADQLADQIRASLHEQLSPSSTKPGVNSGAAQGPLSQEWMQTTAANVKRALQRIVPAMSIASSAYPRRALADLCFALLTKSPRSLETCSQLLFDALLSRLHDDDAGTGDAARKAIEALLARDAFESGGNGNLHTTLRKSLGTLLQALPRQLLSTSEDDVKLLQLQRVLGYVDVLGDSAQEIVSDLIPSISTGLLRALVQRIDSAKLIDNRGHDMASSFNNPTSFPPKRFVYFNDARVGEALFRLFRYFGRIDRILIETSTLFITYLSNESAVSMVDSDDSDDSHITLYQRPLDSLKLGPSLFVSSDNRHRSSSSSATAAEDLTGRSWLPTSAVLALGQLIHVSNINSTVAYSQALEIVRAIVQADVWEQAVTNAELIARFHFRRLFSTPELGHEPKLNTINQMSDLVHVKCAMLETLVAAAHILGRAFRPRLMTVLYPILLSVDAPQQYRTSQCAQIALIHIAAACEYSSVRQMLLENVDYVTQIVVSRLRHLPHHPSVGVVLVAFVKQVGATVVPFVEDILVELLEALDGYHQSEFVSALLLQVLQEIAHTLAPENETLLSACIERRRSQWMISGPSSATSTASHSLSPEVGAFLASLEISHSTDQTGNNASSESAAAFFKERMQQQPKSKIEEDAGEDDAPATGEDPRDKLKADSDGRDLHRAFATKTLEHVGDLLSSPSPAVRLQVLVLLKSLLPTLAQTNDDEKFLPHLHRIWPVWLLRMRDSSVDVRIAAFELLQAALPLSGDFLLRRVLDGVYADLLSLCLYPRTHLSAGASKFSADVGLCQVALETCATLVTSQTVLPGKHERELASATVFACSPHMLKEIQTAGANLAKAMSIKNPDSLFWAFQRSSAATTPELQAVVDSIVFNVEK